MSAPQPASPASPAPSYPPTPKFPPPSRQLTYLSTGALAGACTIPIELAWHTLPSRPPSSPLPVLRAHGPALVARAGIRFWVFDLTRSQLHTTTPLSLLPIWAVGGLAGAAGGVAEVGAQALYRGRVPAAQAMRSQGGKLFLCFGTYTFLATRGAEEVPPRPFWRCWVMSVVAGAVGSGVEAAVEGVRGRALWRGVVPRGAVGIGTVIAVQVTSCEGVRKWVEGGA